MGGFFILRYSPVPPPRRGHPGGVGGTGEVKHQNSRGIKHFIFVKASSIGKISHIFLLMHFEQLIPGNYYHIYNRGVNKESIFREKDNYALFLSKYQKHCTSVFNTYAYNLLGNHFHLIIQVKPELSDQSADKKILNPSQQLGHFFNSYAQSINYKYKRTGSLFESPFHRKHIANDFYLSSAIFYTHNNALRHGFVRSITDWPHSSYHDLIAANKTFLSREAVLDWFGGREQFIQFHIRPNYIIESIWGEV